MLTRWAVVSTQFIGYHRWSSAPKEVSFLQNLHRHVFHVKVRIEQFHAERDVEYLMFQRALNEYVRAHRFAETASCETMAEEILTWVTLTYGTGENYLRSRRCAVTVSEDGENGAVVTCDGK